MESPSSDEHVREPSRKPHWKKPNFWKTFGTMLVIYLILRILITFVLDWSGAPAASGNRFRAFVTDCRTGTERSRSTGESVEVSVSAPPEVSCSAFVGSFLIVEERCRWSSGRIPGVMSIDCTVSHSQGSSHS